MTDSHFTLLLLGIAVALFVSERLPIEIVAIGIMVTLIFRGILDVHEGVAGFSNPALLTVACMFAISAGITSTGAVSMLGHRLTKLAKGEEKRLILLACGVVALTSGFINNTPVVAVFVPLMLGISRKTGIAPSRLLIPISFASIIGGTVTLLGTSTNLLVAGEVDRYSEQGFEMTMFDFAPIGAVLVVVGVSYLYFFGHKKLPHRQGVTTAGTTHEYMTEVIVSAGSRILEGPFPAQLNDGDLRLVQIIRGDRILWPPFDQTQLEEGDILLLKGPPKTLISFLQEQRVDLAPELQEASGSDEVLLKTVDTTLAEIVVTPGSRSIGRSISEIGFRRHHQVSAVGIQRRGSHLRGEISGTPLRLGDVLLVHGSRAAIDLLRGEDDFLLIEGIEETVETRQRAPVALLLCGAVVLGAWWDVKLLLPFALSAVSLMVLSGCMSLRQVFRAIDWTVVVLIAGMLALGKAMGDTGAAREVAGLITDSVASVGLPEKIAPWVMLSLIYLLTAVMTEFVSNNATAVLMTHIAFSTAAELDLSPKPFVFAVAYAASLSFCTPVGYQTNTFVYGPGNYRFSDFFRVGLPLSITCWILCSLLLPIVFPFE